MSYTVQLVPRALEQLAALSLEVQDLCLKVLTRLAVDPRAPSLSCLDQQYQVYHRRFGDGTLVYRIYEAAEVIVVSRIRWRGP